MLNYFLLLLVILANLTHIYGYNEPRIKNGVKTPLNLFQFAVRVFSGGGMGTGTIISKRHVLTAAHCFGNFKNNSTIHERYQERTGKYRIAIRKGIELIDYKMENHSSLKAYAPITWKSKGSDIAILEYPEGTNLGVTPVKLAKDYVEKDGDVAFIAGFGRIEKNETHRWSDLYHANVTMVTRCFGILKICGGNVTHRALFGDSGGPMLIQRNNQWYQIGVSAETGAYDYRTRISSYCDFIEEVTKNEVKCASIFPENHYNGSMLPVKHFEPIYQGQSTPIKLFNFVVPLYNYYYKYSCTATVISKRYLLTSAQCVYQDDWTEKYTKTQPVTHLSFKTITGKLFPDFRSKNVESNLNNDPIDVTAYFPLNYKRPWYHNLAIIEFPEGTDFGIEPVTLAKDFYRIYLEQIIIAGYGKYKVKSDMHLKGTPPMLKHSSDFFLVHSEWKFVVKDNDNLMKDEGGPTLIERNGKLYQFGVNFFSRNYNGYRTPVSTHCNFIEEVTNKEVKCESVLPIYEKPPSESITTILPENLVEPSEAPFTQQSSSIAATKKQFQMATLLFAFVTLICV